MRIICHKSRRNLLVRSPQHKRFDKKHRVDVNEKRKFGKHIPILINTLIDVLIDFGPVWIKCDSVSTYVLVIYVTITLTELRGIN